MKRMLVAAAVLASGLALAAAPPLSANAATASRVTSATTAKPLYSQDISLSIKCATWKGEIAWGGNGSILDPAYIDVSGELKDTCRSGYAQLFLHWDTIDNPKNELVKKVEEDSSARTPYSTNDRFNTYKDIYVYICSEYEGYRCSEDAGPGA